MQEIVLLLFLLCTCYPKLFIYIDKREVIYTSPSNNQLFKIHAGLLWVHFLRLLF